MKNIIEAVTAHAGAQAPALIKHLTASGITDWQNLTKSNLCAFRDHLLNEVAQSSARTYMASLKAIMARYEEEVEIPCKSYRIVLRAKNEKPQKTYLTPDELNMLERLVPYNETERFVQCEFLVGAYTGMRISDTQEVSAENISASQLTYVSKKTSIEATIPCGERVQRLIAWCNEHPKKLTLAGYDKIIKRLCKRAGINSVVKVFKAGKTIIGEKHQFVSSHTARISFATNMANCNVPLLSISKMCGHTSVVMTQRYIVNQNVQLNEKAMAYLK